MGGDVDRLLRLAAQAGDNAETDRSLLRRVASRDEGVAFAELVRRHGPMVLGVCRRVLRHEQDAEDAFQAAFLVLARRAGAVHDPAVANWLFGVARHVAQRLRDKDIRRRRHEAAASLREEPDPLDPHRDEALAALDEELQRLPDRYRSPLVACYLQGRTQEDAARDMGWSLSTLRRRLDRGRELLRARLSGRGVTMSAGAWAGVGALATISPTLAEATKQAAIAFTNGVRGTPPTILAEGLLMTMMRAKFIKIVAVASIALGGVVAAWQVAPGQDNAAKKAEQDPRGKPALPADPFRTPQPGASDTKATPLDDRIKPGDRLHIQGSNVNEANLINGVYIVEPDGRVPLGPTYGGRVKLDGRTVDEAEQVLRDHLRKFVKEAEVSVAREIPPADDRVRKLEDRVQRLEQEVLELRAVIRALPKKPEVSEQPKIELPRDKK